jgi:hypothetical protein
MFQLSLVFYLIQASLQLLIKVPGSQRSEGLWLCSGRHLLLITFKLVVLIYNCYVGGIHYNNFK